MTKFKPRTGLDALIVHCSASPNTGSIGSFEIDQWHRANGWIKCGYHLVIQRDGTIDRHHTRPLQSQGAHAKGHNDRTIGICLVGTDEFTDEQMESLRLILNGYRMDYPDVDILGHRDLPGVNKECPSFDVERWYLSGSLP